MEKSTDSEVFADRALVDLVTGEESRIETMLQRLDSDGSLSNEISDIDDPLYDDSLMEDLFYTKKVIFVAETRLAERISEKS